MKWNYDFTLTVMDYLAWEISKSVLCFSHVLLHLWGPSLTECIPYLLTLSLTNTTKVYATYYCHCPVKTISKSSNRHTVYGFYLTVTIYTNLDITLFLLLVYKLLKGNNMTCVLLDINLTGMSGVHIDSFEYKLFGHFPNVNRLHT